jgi:hypothetical protein
MSHIKIIFFFNFALLRIRHIGKGSESEPEKHYFPAPKLETEQVKVRYFKFTIWPIHIRVTIKNNYSGRKSRISAPLGETFKHISVNLPETSLLLVKTTAMKNCITCSDAALRNEEKSNCRHYLSCF